MLCHSLARMLVESILYDIGNESARFNHVVREQAAGHASVIAYADPFSRGNTGRTLPNYVTAACDKVALQSICFAFSV